MVYSRNNMSDDEKSLLKDVLKQQGWKLIERMNDEAVRQYRILATQQNVKLEDRLWYSALAEGREQALAEVESKCDH